MDSASLRKDGRKTNQLRELSVVYDIFPYAAGSVLFTCGNTKVLCSVMMQQGVPPFLKNKKRGWLTADYAMLPASTSSRSVRESTLGKKNGRSIEISRLLGRSLRSIVSLDALGESTIFIDCDVLCADGGTRGAALIGAFLALRAAESLWLKKKIISQPILSDEIAAFSIGIVKDELMVDLTCSEDNKAQADFNFVVTRSGRIVGLQGGAELAPVDRSQFSEIIDIAFSISERIFDFYALNSYDYQVMSQIVCYYTV